MPRAVHAVHDGAGAAAAQAKGPAKAGVVIQWAALLHARVAVAVAVPVPGPCAAILALWNMHL